MKAKKFDLWLGCLGNGITVCNKAVEEYGDYKKVAHISNNGIIKFYVPADYIPFEDMERIQQTAEKQQADFLKWWNNNTLAFRYMRILDSLTATELCEAYKDNINTLAERVKHLEDKYLLVKEF